MGLDTSPRTTPRKSHISVKYHLFRGYVGEGKEIMTQRVESKDQKAYVFTEVLGEETFNYTSKLLTGW